MDKHKTKNKGVISALAAFVVLVLSVFVPPSPASALTPAGTVISSNSTTFSYRTEGRSVVVNIPSSPITVAQVWIPSVALQNSSVEVIGKPVNGNQVSLLYKVVNAGNGNDVIEMVPVVPQGFSAKLMNSNDEPLADSNKNGDTDTNLIGAEAVRNVIMTLSVPDDYKVGVSYPIGLKVYSAGKAATSTIGGTKLFLVPQNIFVPMTQKADLSQVAPGQTVTFIGEFQNAGGVAASNAVFRAVLDKNVDYVNGSAVSPEGVKDVVVDYDTDTKTLSWSAPSIPADYKGRLSYKVLVKLDTPTDYVISSTLTATSDINSKPDTTTPLQIPVVDPQMIRMMKTSINKEVGIGEFAAYTLSVSNISASTTLNNVFVTDILPQSFRYASGSTLVDGKKGAEPVISKGVVRWDLGTLKPGKTITINYKALVSVGAQYGDAINYASAGGTTPGGKPVVSPMASASIKVKEGVINDKVVVLGRVYEQGTNAGFKGIRLYMEDGTYVVTDPMGKFSLSGIDAGEHVIKLDSTTLPRGYRAVAISTANAGDGNSRFVTAPFGGMVVADFELVKDESVQPEAQTLYNNLFEKKIASMPRTAGIVSPSKGAVVDQKTDLIIRVPYGAEYILEVNGKVLNTANLKSTISDKKEITLYTYRDVEMAKGTNNITLTVGKTVQAVTVSTAGEYDNLPLASRLPKQIASMPRQYAVVFPAAGALVKKTSDIAISVPYGAEYILSVNGDVLNGSSIGLTVSDRNELTVYQHVSINLKAGENKVELADSDGNVKHSLKVFVAGNTSKVVISPEKLEISADGKTSVPFTVTTLDKDGNLTDDVKSVTIETGLGTVILDNDNPATDKQIQVKNGQGTFIIRSGLTTGQDTITVNAGTGLSASADVFYTPEKREWILVGLANATIGLNELSGNIEKVKDGSVEKELYHDERIAFFAKGQILGKYIITAMYDSNKKGSSELFKKIDPNKYYPIYGDTSTSGNEAPTIKNYFVKIEAGKSSLTVGDINTGMGQTEFGAYDRKFNGAKLDINEENVTAKGFVTSTNHSMGHDTIPGNGTSGYYFLSKQSILENSERIVLETRDRFHPEILVGEPVTLSSSDYTIDYRNGTIMFNKPVSSTDSNLNQILIQVYYESDDSSDKNLIYGGRVSVRDEIGELGVTGINQEAGTGNNKIYGVDATVRPMKEISIRAEAFQSETIEKGKGQAGKVETTIEAGKGKITGYVRKVTDKFFNPASSVESDVTKFGAKGEYPLTNDKKTSAFVDGYVSKKELSPNQDVTNISAGVVHAGEEYSAQVGARHIKGNDQDGAPAEQDVVFAGVGKKFGKGELYIGREQIVSGDTSPVDLFPTRTIVKATIPVTDKTSLVATTEIQDNGKHSATAGFTHQATKDTIVTTNYTAATGTVQTNTVGTEVASKWDFVKGLNMTSKVGGAAVQDTANGNRTQALIGVGADYEITKGIKVAAKAERVQLVTGNKDPNGINTAIATSFDHTMDDVKTTIKYEFRTTASETTHLYGYNGIYRLSPSFSLLTKNTFWTSRKTTGTDSLKESEIGLSYRSLNPKGFNILSLLKVKDDTKGSLLVPTRQLAIVGSVEGSKKLSDSLSVMAKYAGKAYQETDVVETQAYTDMVVLGATYEINNKWDVSGYGKFQHQYETGMSDLGAIAKIGYTVAKNTRLGVGYNFSKLNDKDFGDGYGSKGVFFDIKVKFDEKSVSGLFKEVFSF